MGSFVIYVIFELKSKEVLCLMTKMTKMMLSKMTRNFANCHMLNNSDFLLESKMGELNKNKNSKQPDPLDAV